MNKEVENHNQKKFIGINVYCESFIIFDLLLESHYYFAKYVQLKFLRGNDFTEWIFTFLLTFQTISKKGWVETLLFSFLLITFSTF